MPAGILMTSLQCPHCKKAFEASAQSDAAPQSLPCGGVLCKPCFETEKLLPMNERQYKCRDGINNCFDFSFTAFYLFEIIELFQSGTPKRDLLKSSRLEKLLECPVCFTNYSLDESELPFLLICGHIICKSCHDTIKEDLDEEVAANFQYEKYIAECPKCKQGTLTGDNESLENGLTNFLAEFAKLKESLDKDRCLECTRLFDLDDMWECTTCNKSSICSTCNVRRHKNHDVVNRMDHEISQLVTATRTQVGMQISAYQDTLPLTQISEIITGLKERLDCAFEKTSQMERQREVEETLEAIRNMGNQFETLSDDVFGHLRRYIKAVEDLIKEADAKGWTLTLNE